MEAASQGYQPSREAKSVRGVACRAIELSFIASEGAVVLNQSAEALLLSTIGSDPVADAGTYRKRLLKLDGIGAAVGAFSVGEV
jgi:hypothetical protein